MRLGYTFKKLDKVVKSYLGKLPALKPMGDYSNIQKDKYRQVVIFIHAEFETYIEGLCTSIVENSLTKYNNKNKINTPLAYLLYRTEINSIKEDLNFIVHRFVSKYKSSLTGVSPNSNHGIKENNLKKMFFPLGLEHILLDSPLNPDFISNINQLGSDRGLFAHSSSLNPQIISRIQPVDFKKMVFEILAGLKYIETYIKRTSF